MKFSEIVQRLTGISTPVFGASWNPPEAERTVARRIVTFLEDRRVLYVPSAMEVPEHCVHSVLEIREFLTSEIGALGDGSKLCDALRGMRAACRKFMQTVGADEDIVRYGAHRGHWASWTFNGALGELRGVFGIHVAQIAAQYGLDVEDELASILPGKDEKSRSSRSWNNA